MPNHSGSSARMRWTSAAAPPPRSTFTVSTATPTVSRSTQSCADRFLVGTRLPSEHPGSRRRPAAAPPRVSEGVVVRANRRLTPRKRLLDRLTIAGPQDAPVDQPLRKLARRLVVDDGQSQQVFLANRQDLAVVVPPVRLDRRGEQRQRRSLGEVELVEPLEVENELRRGLAVRSELVRARKQLAHGHAVEIGELGESLHGHRSVAALIGADDHGLPLPIGLLLHTLEGEALLLSNGPKADPESLRVVLCHCCPFTLRKHRTHEERQNLDVVPFGLEDIL